MLTEQAEMRGEETVEFLEGAAVGRTVAVIVGVDVEDGEERSVGFQKVGYAGDVLFAEGGVDRAEAGVFEGGVEGGELIDRRDEEVLEVVLFVADGWKGAGGGDGAGGDIPADGGGGRVGREGADVVTEAAAGDENAAGERGGLKVLDEGRMGGAFFPGDVVGAVAGFPVGFGICGHGFRKKSAR